MVLVDTSVWIDHFRRGTPELVLLLENDLVLMHPMVLGELACGNAKNRTELLAGLGKLPQATEARHSEVLAFLEQARLWGKGLGWVDMHVLAAVKLSGARLWTRDAGLQVAAERCGAGLFSGARPHSGGR